MNKLSILIIISLFTILNTSCDKGCNECLQLVTKNIIVVDSLDNDLIFGNNSIYNPDSINILLSNSNKASFTIDSQEKNINLIIENETYNYHLHLNDSVNYKINFTQNIIPSPNCCGDIPEISNTFLDNHEIGNGFNIKIVE